MYCRKCGKQIDDNSRFCSFCGEDLSSNAKTDQEEHGKKRKVVFDGEIHKCPNCGEILDAFVTKCPTCGFEIRGTKGGTNKVEELAEKLQKTNNISKKKELISNFYVPNTKEDIIEFFTLAVSQIDDDNACSEAWCSKLDQTLIKAKLSFGNTEEYKYLVKLYGDAKKNKKKEDAKKHRRITIRIIASVILGIAGTVFMVIGIIGANKSGDPDSPLYMFAFLGFFLYLAVAYVWLSLTFTNKDSDKKKKKVTTVTTSKGSKKTVKVKKVEFESETDEDNSDEDEEESDEDEDGYDEENDDFDEEEDESDEDKSDEDESDEEDDSDDEEVIEKTVEVVEEETSKNEPKSLKDEFKEIGKQFKDMFK